MKAVIPELPDFIVEWRKRTGADRYDELWDGVLHMGPTPNRAHQEFEWALETWLRMHWAPVSSGKVYHEVNVAAEGRWPENYRVPDVVLLTTERLVIDRNEYFDGAPSAVVEIHSPGDEAYEKLPFYASIGVPEVWIIHRDSKQFELYELATGEYRRQEPTAGWFRSSLGIQFQTAPENKLRIQLSADVASQRLLPEG